MEALKLTQEQLNASILIDALARINAINTNPKYGFGKETLELVQSHINGWDYISRVELVNNMSRITENLHPGYKLILVKQE